MYFTLLLLTDSPASLQQDYLCPLSLESSPAPQVRWCCVPLSHCQIITWRKYGSCMSCLPPTREEYSCFPRVQIVLITFHTVSLVVLTCSYCCKTEKHLVLGYWCMLQVKTQGSWFQRSQSLCWVAYMVNNDLYQQYLSANMDPVEPVHLHCLLDCIDR